MCLFLAVLGLCCFVGFSLVLVRGDYTLVLVHVLLIAVTSVVEHRLWGMQALVVVAHGLSRCSSQALEHRLRIVAHKHIFSATCGTLPGQGLNPCLLHWQADSS